MNRVVPLRYRADWRSLLLLGGLTALLTVQWAGWLRHGPWPAVACALAFIAGVIKHNHVHCRTFTSRAWNAGFGHVLSVLTGHPTTAIITAHNIRHHRHNNTDLDWVRSSLVAYRWNWLNLVVFPFASVARMRAEKASDLGPWRRRAAGLYRQALAERVVLYGAAGGLLVADWSSTLRSLVVPWLFGQWAIVTINLLQHQGCDPQSPYDHSRNVTGRLINWFLLNNGLHTAHHLRPSVHWSLLPELHRRLVAPRIEPGLNQRSMLVAVWREFGPGRRPVPAKGA